MFSMCLNYCLWHGPLSLTIEIYFNFKSSFWWNLCAFTRALNAPISIKELSRCTSLAWTHIFDHCLPLFYFYSKGALINLLNS